MSRLAAQREGIHAALWRAKEAAGEKDVRLGGVETIQQFLRAGLIDEMHHARRAGPERGVIELTHDSYGDFVRRHRLAVVHFWAAWNGYDAQMKSFLETEIPGEWRDRVAVGTIDTDRSEHLGDLGKQLQIRNLPFLAFYRDGLLIGTVTGLRQQEALERFRDLVS